jgi:hypothetical protein
MIMKWKNDFFVDKTIVTQMMCCLWSDKSSFPTQLHFVGWLGQVKRRRTPNLNLPNFGPSHPITPQIHHSEQATTKKPAISIYKTC